MKEALNNKNDDLLYTLNVKCINILYCSITFEKFNLVSFCGIAIDMWNKQLVTYEETTQVKDTKKH